MSDAASSEMTELMKGESIIYFGPEPWAGLWRNRHQLMSRLAQNNNVWYVEPPTKLRSLFDGRKHRTRLSSRDASGVNIFHSPWWLPIVGRAPLKNLTIRLYLFFLSRLANEAGEKPYVWLSRPSMIDLLEFLPAKKSIYHVVDEYSGYGSPSAPQRERLLGKEAELLRQVDAAIVVTPSLLQAKSKHNDKTFLVRNAADFREYSECDATVPEDMRDIRGPIIGYTGLIAARLDLAMLTMAAAERPNWSFVFVGIVNTEQCKQEMETLENADNVYFLGQKDVADTPRYVRQFDVATIPYVPNLRAQNASPLKLYEYAAASKPIVATDFEAAREFSGHIEIVRNANEFIEACERCLKIEPSAPEILENHRFASENTWDKRVEEISEIMQADI